jgi:hypothetical protein
MEEKKDELVVSIFTPSSRKGGCSSRVRQLLLFCPGGDIIAFRIRYSAGLQRRTIDQGDCDNSIQDDAKIKKLQKDLKGLVKAVSADE